MRHQDKAETPGVQSISLSTDYLRGLVEAVGSVRPDDVCGEAVVVALGQVRSLLNWAGAREMALIAGLTRKPLMSPPIPTPSGVPRQVMIESGVDVAVGEVSAVQCSSVLSARRRVDQAVQVTRDLPATFAAMSTGLLDSYRAKIMVEELLEAATDSGESVVPPEVRAEIEAAVIPRAHELTPSQLRYRLRREIARRCTGKRAVRDRGALRPKVEVGPLPGGLGYLYAVLPADAAALAEITLESMARVLAAASRTTTPKAATPAATPSTDPQAGDPAAGVPVPPFTRRDNQSEASWRAEQRDWARAEALSVVFRSLADARPLPVVTAPTTTPAEPDAQAAHPTDWPYTHGGLDYPTQPAQPDQPTQPGRSSEPARPGESGQPSEPGRPDESGRSSEPGRSGEGPEAPSRSDDGSNPERVIAWWLPPLLPAAHGRAPHLNLTVALSTLRGMDNEPADLDGYGPIPADLARQLATQITARYDTATFTLIGLDQHGTCVHVGTRTPYRPTQTLRDNVTARHRRCRAPGCRRPSAQCDLDHRVPHADGGPTCEHNLDPLCRFHHRLKTFAGWQVRNAPPGTDRPPGTLEWITTYGTRRYTQPDPWPTNTEPDPDPNPDPNQESADPPF